VELSAVVWSWAKQPEPFSLTEGCEEHPLLKDVGGTFISMLLPMFQPVLLSLLHK